MTGRAMRAAAWRDARGMLPPVTGVTVLLLAAVLIQHQTGGGPFPVASPLWCLFGLLTGAGLVARDTRLGLSRMIRALPVSMQRLTAIRFVSRWAVTLLASLAILGLKYMLDIWLWSGSAAFGSGVYIYHNPADVVVELLLGVSAGFGAAAAFGILGRRETVAFAGGFLVLLTAFIMFIGLMIAHPQYFLMLRFGENLIPWFAVSLLLAGLVSVTWNASSPEPETRFQLKRVTVPLAVCLLVNTGLYALVPVWVLSKPLESWNLNARFDVVPASNELLVMNELGLWRLKNGRGERFTTPMVYQAHMSPDGAACAVLKQAQHILRFNEDRLLFLERDGTEICTVKDRFSYYGGRWSPDSRSYVIQSLHDGLICMNVYRPDREEPVLTWSPPDCTEENRRRLYLAGWEDDRAFLVFDTAWSDRIGTPMRLWQVSLSGGETRLWSGNLGPGNVNVYMFMHSILVSSASRSVIIKQWDNSNEPGGANLLQIFWDGRPARLIGETQTNSRIVMDSKGRYLTWTAMDRDSNTPTCHAAVSDLVTGTTRLHRNMPFLGSIAMSPSGEYIAGHQLPEQNAETPAAIVRMDTGEIVAEFPGVRDLLWTGANSLAMIMTSGEVRRFDPETGQTELMLQPENRKASHG